MMKIILLIAVSALFSAGASAGKFCAKEGETCECVGKAKFGIDDKWTVEKDVEGSIGCSRNDFDNVDPAPRAKKECRCIPNEPPQCLVHHNFDDLNVALAMTGYDSFIGNPFDTIVDPGIKATIFDPDCSLVLEDAAADLSASKPGPFGLTFSQVHRALGFYGFISRAGKDLNCNSDFSMKTFQDMQSYNTERTQSNEASLSGSVSANANAWGVAMKASASYSKETNRDEKAASKLLEQGNGEIILAEATCITESVSIAKEVRPMFTRAFIKQLEKLDSVSANINVTLKDEAIREFIHEFGTHFSQETKLGASLTYERRFSKKSAENEDGMSRSECVKEEAKASLSGQHAVAGGEVKVSGKSKECESLKEDSKFSNEEGIESTRIISRGSRPKTLQEWVDADFTPVPIKRYLAPLSYLFKDEWLSKNEHYGFERSLRGRRLSKIFDDAFAKYCSLMLGDILDENCEHITCTGYVCQNNGQCKMSTDTNDPRPYCECPAGHTGGHCENAPECLSNEECSDGQFCDTNNGHKCIPLPYVKLDGVAKYCAWDKEINSEAECRDALRFALAMGITLGDRDQLITGSWDHVPMGCSYQANGDGAFHFNLKDESELEMEELEDTPSGFQDGTFKMICRRGRNVDIGIGLPTEAPSPTEEALTEDNEQTTTNVDPLTTRRPARTERPTRRPERRPTTTTEDWSYDYDDEIEY